MQAAGVPFTVQTDSRNIAAADAPLNAPFYTPTSLNASMTSGAPGGSVLDTSP